MILVTGANGQLGSDVCDRLALLSLPYIGVDVDTLDLTDSAAVTAFFDMHTEIDSVIHCAAYTAVDRAEEEPERCFAVNRDATAHLASCCGDKIKLLYVSTDYVFGADGDAYSLPLDPKHPLNVYGASKSAGEDAVLHICKKHFIVRTSWVFGEQGRNFIATMLRLSETHDRLSVVCDQIGSPTYAKDLAVLLCDMIQTDRYGIYHATNENVCSWYDLAKTVFALTGKSVALQPVTTAQYAAKALRPLNSRLSKVCLDENGFSRLRPWQDAVRAYLENIGAIR